MPLSAGTDDAGFCAASILVNLMPSTEQISAQLAAESLIACEIEGARADNRTAKHAIQTVILCFALVILMRAFYQDFLSGFDVCAVSIGISANRFRKLFQVLHLLTHLIDQ